MARGNAPFVSFNGGEIGKEIIARTSLDNYGACASQLENIFPEAAGPMSKRPGLGFRSEMIGDTKLKKFVYDLDQKYLLAFSDNALRIIQDGGVVIRPAVSCAIGDSGFDASLAGPAAATLSSSALAATNVLSKLVDGDTLTTTQWSTASLGTLTFDLASAKTATSIQLAAGSNALLAPTSFTVKGSTTGTFGGEEVTLLTKTGVVWTARETKILDLTTTGSFRYYRLSMTASPGQIGVALPNQSYMLSEAYMIANVTGWIDSSDGSGLASTGSSLLVLNSNGTQRAGARQQVTTASPNVEHAIEINIPTGPVFFKVGTGGGLDDYVSTTELRTGFHSIAFTPTSTTFWIEIYSIVPWQTLVASATIAAAGDLVIATPWLASDFNSLRFQQSRDVIYVAGGGTAKRRIERRSASSWSLALTDESDGPFIAPNIDDSLTLAPSVKVGIGFLTASKPIFEPGHYKALFQLTQTGQYQQRVITDANQWSDPIKITGVGATGRAFVWSVAGTFVGTIKVQESADKISWNDADATWTTGTITTTSTSGSPYTVGDYISSSDNRNNEVWYYRIGVAAGGWTSGSALVTLSTGTGNQTGIGRIEGYVSPTSVFVNALKTFSSTGPTPDWIEGAWSDVQGQPRAIALFDDRLWNGFLDQYWASQSSLYEAMATGSDDALAIWRSIATGDVGAIQWILALSRVVIGTNSAEDVIRSDSLDSPITPTNLTVRDVSSWGSADVAPLKIDSQGIFIDRSGVHAMALAFSSDIQDYVGKPLTRLHRDIGRPGLGQIAVSRRPETRLFICRNDGQCLTKLYDPGENVLGWSRIVTPGGKITSVESLPGTSGTSQDENYFITKRRFQGVTRYFLEMLGPSHLDYKAEASNLDAYLRFDGPLCQAVNLAGTSALRRSSDLVGNVDGKAGLFAFWINLTGGDGQNGVLYSTTGGALAVTRTAAGKWQIVGKNSSATTVLKLQSAKIYTTTSGWHHVAFAWDLASGKGQLTINGVADLDATQTVLTNANIDYTQTQHDIGYDGSGNYLTGDLAQLIYAHAFLDLSVVTNRNKLISPSRRPVYLNDNGSWPTGAQPLIYLANDADSFETNLGSGGNFTVAVGYLDDATPPYPRLAAQSKTVSGLDHLIGQTVTAYADGLNVGSYLVNVSGQITLPVQPAFLCVGLDYNGLYQSPRLAFMAQAGTPQAQQQQATKISFIYSRSATKVMYGADFNDMNDISLIPIATQTDDENGLISGISEPMPIPGGMSRDPRVCLKLPGPEPITLAGYIVSANLVERAS